MKRCHKCGIEKDESEFHKDCTSEDGLRSLCKICVRSYQKARYATLALSVPVHEDGFQKRCSKCGIIKDFLEFSKDRTHKDGLHCSCKECEDKWHVQNYIKNKDVIKARTSKYWKDHIEQSKLAKRVWRAKNLDKAHAYEAKYRATPNGQEKTKANGKKWRKNNLERVREISRECNKRNRSHINKHKRERLATDILFKISINLRITISKAIRGKVKGGSAVRDLGCTIPEFLKYLESKFQPGMTWANYGWGKNKWVIDHRVPLANFVLTDREQFLKACHYTNLQPLWFEENLAKSDWLPEEWENIKSKMLPEELARLKPQI